jgi:hypothetical protein
MTKYYLTENTMVIGIMTNDSYDDIDNESEESCNDDEHRSCNSDDALLTDDYSDSNAYRRSSLRGNLANRRFEIMLFQLIMTHRASLAMFDDICQLVEEYTSSPDFTVFSSKLSRQKPLIRLLEHSFKTQALRPKNITIKLHDNARVTVPTFDTKAMIIDLLTDKSLMNESNFAEGYNVFTGAGS